MGLGTFFRDYVKDPIGDVYNDVTGVTTAREAGAAQQAALGQAREATEQGYGRAQEALDPYAQAGRGGLDALSTGIQQDQFRPDAFRSPNTITQFRDFGQTVGADQFDYQGQPMAGQNYQGQPVSQMDYQGQPVSQMDYQGQARRDIGYEGQPVDRSIESYMQDDPGLAWQQEQLQKQIDRAGAAQGRWGGGATARETMREQAGLLAQDYGNRFARAGQERMADVGAEQQRYGRALTGFDVGRQAEQEDYGRAQYGTELERMGEQERFGRAQYGTELGRMAEQERFGRDRMAFEDQRGAEQEDFRRAGLGFDRLRQAEDDRRQRYVQDYGMLRAGEDAKYGRALGEYGMEQERGINRMNQLMGLTNIGQQAAGGLASAAVGQGTSMADLQIQQGNVAAAQRMAEGSPWSNALDLGMRVSDVANEAGRAAAGGM